MRWPELAKTPTAYTRKVFWWQVREMPLASVSVGEIYEGERSEPDGATPVACCEMTLVLHMSSRHLEALRFPRRLVWVIVVRCGGTRDGSVQHTVMMRTRTRPLLHFCALRENDHEPGKCGINAFMRGKLEENMATS